MELITTDGPPVLIEPVPIAETFATGILPPEDHGTHFRVVVFDQRYILGGDALERFVVGRLVFSKPGFYSALRVARKAVGDRTGTLRGV
jgi:hypothetical protein